MKSSLASTETQRGQTNFWQQRATRVVTWVWQRPWLALPLLAIPALSPLFHLDLTISHDGAIHLLRLAVLDQHVQQGTFFPRWVPELFAGLGYPVFNFYGPFFYYLAEFLHLIGLDLVSAMLASFGILVLAAGAGMYLLALDVFGAQRRWPALVAATAYMYAPYLLTNLYVRGAVAELSAQAWLPWIFWSARRLMTVERPSPYVLALAITLGGLAVTHSITLLFAPVVLVCYILILWSRSGRPANRLFWMGIAIAAAMGLSAFLWLPMIVEKQYLAEYAYEVAAKSLPMHTWTWRNFLDTTLRFQLDGVVPFQLGLTQLVLALIGVILAGRRDAEWLFFVALAVLAGIGMSAWTAPIWFNSKTLLVAQFPWRLLVFMSLALALLTGGLLLRLRRDVWQFAGAVVLIAVIILFNRPDISGKEVLAHAGDRIDIAYIPRFENERDALGTSYSREFWPRWTNGATYEPTSADGSVQQVDIALAAADAYRIKATVSTQTGGPLRFTSLFYPAWRVTLDGTPLPAYPSTNMGLLTVDLPPGSHELSVDWAGTDVQHVATWCSLLTLAGLTLLVWRVNRKRWLAVLPLSLLVLGLATMVSRPALTAIETPAQPVATSSLELLGYRLQQGDAYDLTVYPYWYARENPSADVSVSWQLRDETGQVLSELSSRPFYNSQDARNWPAGTLVDDAYHLFLPNPSGDPPHSYQLAVRLAEGDEATTWTTVGEINVTAPPPPQPQPEHALSARFGGLLDLLGTDVKHGGRSVDDLGPRPPVVRPGDSLEYTLYWRALRPLTEDYHGFIHLVDSQQNALIKQDKLVGSPIKGTSLWGMTDSNRDRYSFRIPEDAHSGLYWPKTGLYEFKTVDLMPVVDGNGQPLGDSYLLPPVKVLADNPSIAPQHPVSAQMGDLATLLGYDLDLPEDGIQAGSQFSLTLYYQVAKETNQDLTQFIQVFNPDLGMAAQQDAPPQDGANPTWAWEPGETVVDVRTLRIRDDAQPGQYQLLVGLYDPADGTRLEVQDAQGATLPDGQVRLTVLPVVP